MVILDPELDERTVAPSLDKFLNVIREDGGTVDNVDVWGRRRLAYEIAKKSEGIYAVVDFTASPAASVELDRQLKLNETVLRTKVLRKEHAVAIATHAKPVVERRAARAAAAPPAEPEAAEAAEAAAPATPAAARPAKPAAPAAPAPAAPAAAPEPAAED
jgi:small subunit ribosomal protein S6